MKLEAKPNELEAKPIKLAANPWMLLRGLTRGNGHWGNFALLMQERGFDIELMEIPGNGTLHLEDSPINVHTTIDMIRTRSRLLRAGQKFNICGISLGGIIALKWAELYPNDLLSVVAVNSSLRQLSPPHDRMRLSSLMYVVTALALANPKHREKMILKLTSNGADKFAFLAAAAKFAERYPVRRLNFIRQIILANNISIGSTGATVPIKIVASQMDRLVHYSCSLRLARYFGIEPHIHPTAGHDLPLDDPEWLLSTLTSET